MRVITIGRSQDNDFVINDDRVSRIHLQMVQDDNGNFSVVDLNSLNGTFVNGYRITGEYCLQASDTVRIGNTVLPWQSYFNPSHDEIIIDEIPEQKPKHKPKRTFWIVAIVVLLLLVCGGIAWKVYHDKKQERIESEIKAKAEEEKRIQEENEWKIAEEKRIQDEATKNIEESLISQRETEKRAKEEERKAKEEEQKAKESEIKAKEAEQKAKESAQKEAEENQKKKDKTEFDKLKIEAEILKGRGANPDEKIDQMKKIADKYPTDQYFRNTITNLED